MLAQSDLTAPADQPPQHPRNSIATGIQVVQVFRGKCVFSAEQAEAGEGFGN
jgi:hypothetical protein